MAKYLLLLFMGFYAHLFSQNSTDKILFIGNSMTYYNNMPEIFAGIAQSKGKTVQTVQHAPGGTGFTNHVNDTALYDIIRNNIFDKVVLQPGTSESGGASFPVTVTAQNGNRIKDSIKKYSPCAQLFLYEISNGIISANDYPTYYATQKRIKDSISKMSVLMQIPMIPAGEAARKHYENQQDMLLHSNYGDVHPNLNGSYLIASTMYAAIYQDTVFPSSHVAGVSQTTAGYLQGIADDTVLNHLSNWNLTNFNLFANFNYNIAGFSVNFQNQSINSGSVLWDFGDGTTSAQTNPVHQYTSPGVYTVTLSAFSGTCQIKRMKTVAVEVLSTNEFHKKEFKIYPNPASEFFKIESDSLISTVEIYSPSGNLLMTTKNIGSKIYRGDISSFSPGIYFIKIIFKNSDTIHYKLIKK